MPIVGGSNTAKNLIQIEADLLDNVSSKLDTIEKNLDETTAKQKQSMSDLAQATTQQADTSVSAAQRAGLAWTEFRSMYSTVLDVVRAGQEVWTATAGKFIDYAAEIQKAQRQLGLSTEDAARMIQIADKVGTSYEQISTAMGIAQKKGIDVSIQGMEKLSDEYLKLAPGTERAQFAADKFGRGWQAIVPILEKGSGTLDKLNQSVEKGLIPTEAAVKQAEQYKISVKELGDAWDAFVYKTAPAVISATTSIVNAERDNIRTAEILMANGGPLAFLDINQRNAAHDKAVAERESSDALMAMANSQSDATGTMDGSTTAVVDNKSAVEAATQAYDDYKNKLDEVSKSNQDSEGFIQKYADFQKSYIDQHAAAVQKLADAEEKLSRAQDKNYGKGKNAGDNRSNAIDDAKNAVADAQKGITDLEVTWHQSTNKMIYDMVLAKVSVDGLTDAEFKATQELAVQMGIRTQAEADQANAMMDKANAIVDGIEKQENVANDNKATQDKLLALEQAKTDAANNTTAATVNGANQSVGAIDRVTAATQTEISEQQRLAMAAQRTAAAYASINYSAAPAPAPTGYTGGYTKTRDSGGWGTAGEAYMINPIAAPEIFVPQESGTFYPNADKLGSKQVTYNIVVNNPKPDTASNSLRTTLQKLSYIGTGA